MDKTPAHEIISASGNIWSYSRMMENKLSVSSDGI